MKWLRAIFFLSRSTPDILFPFLFLLPKEKKKKDESKDGRIKFPTDLQDTSTKKVVLFD